MLKFGREIELDKLDDMTENKVQLFEARLNNYVQAADELKRDLGQGERSRERGLDMLEVCKYQREFLHFRMKLLAFGINLPASHQTIRTNCANSEETNLKLESSLSATQSKLVRYTTSFCFHAKQVADIGIGAAKREQEDRERLSQLVRLQAREIEAIRAEISVLSHKGLFYATEHVADVCRRTCIHSSRACMSR